MRVTLRCRCFCVTEELADDRQSQTSAGSERSEAVAQVMQAEPRQPGPSRKRRPRLVEIGPRAFGSLPAITYGPSRGSWSRTCKAGPFRTTTRLPVFDEGRSSRPRSKSMSTQRRCRISRRRQPVNRSRRTAPVACGPRIVRRPFFGTCFDVGRLSSMSHGMPSRLRFPESRPKPLELSNRKISFSSFLREWLDALRSAGSRARPTRIALRNGRVSRWRARRDWQ